MALARGERGGACSEDEARALAWRKKERTRRQREAAIAILFIPLTSVD